MSFSINLKKNEDGTYNITSTTPDQNPEELNVSGHVDPVTGQTVDLSARVSGLFTSASRR